MNQIEANHHFQAANRRAKKLFRAVTTGITLLVLALLMAALLPGGGVGKSMLKPVVKDFQDNYWKFHAPR